MTRIRAAIVARAHRLDATLAEYGRARFVFFDGYFSEVAPAALRIAGRALDDAGIDQVITHRPAYRAGRSVFETYPPVG